MKVVLLNLPGKFLYTRDYFCSKVAKVDYVEHPVDLLILTGILSKFHQICLLDAIVEKRSPRETAEQISIEKPDATILTDFGCPHTCKFCLYPSLGFKKRKLQNVLEELDRLKALGIREIFDKDQAFGVDRKRTFELCREMCARGHFSWTCFYMRPSYFLKRLGKLRTRNELRMLLKSGYSLFKWRFEKLLGKLL